MTGGFVLAGVLGAAFALQPPGTFHGGEPVARDGERWLALHVSADDAALIETTLEVRAVEDALLDAPGERSGREVASRLEESGIVTYLRGPGLHAGPVVQAQRSTDTTDQAGAPPTTTLTLLARHYRIERRCGPARTAQADDPEQLLCRFVLGDGRTEQVLFEAPAYLEPQGEGGAPVIVSDATAEVLFAGDLDRDGRLDLILDATDHYNVSRPTLLLSTQAQRGQIVGQAAQYESVGC
ncbi:hypothetical protein ACFFGH_16810 [Lysobacter korlensis]|uniref:VCBS repeat-containing protein n=1 Tax=Lysobacter korlensis TaxID=553636 RepID=A0ABV6RRA2_9GAMM